MALILVVDDVEDNRALLQLDLEDEGHEVLFAENGDAAVRQIDQHDVDLVLLDINMPGMSGIDVLKVVKQNPVHENLPIIMVTANDMDGQVVQALDLGANDYITKPYAYPVLAARMRTSLRLKRALDNVRRANKRLEVMATIDSLTGFYVRRHFFELSNKEVVKCLRYERVLAIAVLDIDHLEKINETYGQDAGDNVLIHLGERIREFVRQSDIIARIEGDSFAVCMPDTTMDDAKVLFDRLLVDVAARPLALSRADKSKVAVIGCSVGVAAHVQPEDDIVGAWRRAGGALFSAKKNGGNAIILA